MAIDSLLLNEGGFLLLNDGGHFLLASRPAAFVSGGWRRQSGHSTPEPFKPPPRLPPVDGVGASIQGDQSASGLFETSVPVRAARDSRAVEGPVGRITIAADFQSSSLHTMGSSAMARQSVEFTAKSHAVAISSAGVASGAALMTIESDLFNAETPNYEGEFDRFEPVDMRS